MCKLSQSLIAGHRFCASIVQQGRRCGSAFQKGPKQPAKSAAQTGRQTETIGRGA